MTEATRMNAVGSINPKTAQYNSVRSAGVRAHSVVSRSTEAVLERDRRALREKTGAPVIVKKRVKASPFPISFVFYTLVMMVILMFVVYNHSVVNELTYETGELQSKIAQAKQDNETYSLELENMYDLEYIEHVARTEYGLVKSSEVKKVYVNISEGDRAVVTDNSVYN